MNENARMLACMLLDNQPSLADQGKANNALSRLFGQKSDTALFLTVLENLFVGASRSTAQGNAEKT